MFTASMAFDLGEDVLALRDMVHRWAQERVAPIAAEVDQTNVFPADLWGEMGELGLLGITVEEEFGGAGMGYLAHTVAVEEIARASAWSTSRARSMRCWPTASEAGGASLSGAFRSREGTVVMLEGIRGGSGEEQTS